jgi:hypothetical protein
MDFYVIRVRGQLSDQWSQWFSGLEIVVGDKEEADVTTLQGPIRDQSALRGILNKIWDLNLDLLSVDRLEGVPDRRRESRIPEDEDNDGRLRTNLY